MIVANVNPTEKGAYRVGDGLLDRGVTVNKARWVNCREPLMELSCG
jgi:hypothetical protein